MRYLLLIFALASCSPEARLSRLLKNHPELIKRDTVFKNDTIVVAARAVDTVIHYIQRDTVIVKENGATIKYYFNTKDSTVYLRGECDTIKIIREVPVVVNSVQAKPLGWWDRVKDYVIALCLGAILALFILQFFRRK